MRIWFDTEFIEDGKTIDLISIGMVREDGQFFYAINNECAFERASPWVVENVINHLPPTDHESWMSRGAIRNHILAFATPYGEKTPEFWAYYCSYDWVVLCQLFGTMMDLPEGWPKFCRDIKQLAVMRGDPELPSKPELEHHALADAMWTKSAWEFLGGDVVFPLQT